MDYNQLEEWKRDAYPVKEAMVPKCILESQETPPSLEVVQGLQAALSNEDVPRVPVPMVAYD